MSADLLRKAAREMRENAEAATPGPWVADMYDVLTAHEAAQVADCFDDAEPNAEHIASWHPAVALAVADWLEAEAEAVEIQVQWDRNYRMRENDEALAVARVYLGADA